MTTTTPPTDTLLFPFAASAIPTTLTQLKRANLSITNRLHSIASDAAFVQRIAGTLDLPLIANERCGSWYIPSASEKAGSAYFKSTDGHHGQWSFSLRRLNLQVLDVVASEGKEGCIIVDSTRKGKSMPDALSKTVPIWICVLNRLLFPDNEAAGRLRTPEAVVGRSEHAQIEQRIPQLVAEAQSLALDWTGLRSKLEQKPMLPSWVTPDTAVGKDFLTRSPEYNHVVLCTASSRSSSAGSLGAAYVQGAADDSESWALRLDSATFWDNSSRLLSTNEDDLPAAIAEVVSGRDGRSEVRPATLVRPTLTVWLGSNETAEEEYHKYHLVISCADGPMRAVAEGMKNRYVHFECSSGKVGSRQLRAQLTKLDAVKPLLTPDSKVLVTCHTGKDLAVGAALALICRVCNDAGEMALKNSDSLLNKTVIKHRLSWIMVSMPDASPSRATLQSVNASLLG